MKIRWRRLERQIILLVAMRAPNRIQVLPFRLLVSSADAESAGQVIAEALAGGAAAADEAELEGEAAGDKPPDDSGSGWAGFL